MNPEDIVVIYHDPCTDGFCSAYLFYLCYGDRVTYIPVAAGNISDLPKLEAIRNKHVYFLDCSAPNDILTEMATIAKSITILDHHKTASHVVELLDDNIISGKFNITKSGAGLTLEHLIDEHGFHFDEDIFDLVDYVQDRDLWAWKLENSEEVSAALESYRLDFDVWNSIPSVENLMDIGRHILRYKYQLVAEHVKKAKLEWLDTWLVPHVDCSVKKLASEIGHALAKDMPFSVVRVITDKGIEFSLRSVEGGEDVSIIAQKHGGGGHKHAAGFTVTI